MALAGTVLLGVLLLKPFSVNSMESNILENWSSDNGGASLPSCKESPLHIAVRAGDQRRVNDLIKGGADIYGLDCQGQTPMHLALLQESDEMVLALVRNKFDVNRRFGRGRAVLFYGAVYGREKPLRRLVDVGALVDVVDSEGCTPLYEAVAAYRTDMAKVLLTLGADPKKKLPGGGTYLHRAAEDDNFGAAYFFAGLGTPLDAANDQGETALTKSVLRNNPALVNLLLSRGASISKTDGKGQTYLQLAANSNSSEALQALLENGAPVDSATSKYGSVFDFAVKEDRVDIIRILLSNKADARKVSKEGDTYLHIAARHDSSSALQLLLENRVPIDSVNYNDETPLTVAVKRDSTRIIEKLLKNKADVNRLSKQGDSYLHIAAAYDSTYALKTFLQEGLPVDFVNRNDETALTSAVKKDAIHTINILLKHKADVNRLSKQGESYLHIAAAYNSIYALQIFLQEGLPVDFVSKNDKTALTIAVEKDEVDLIDILLKNKADINRLSSGRETYLHIAASYNSTNAIKTLLNVGEEVDPLNSNGETPLGKAVVRNNPNIISILADYKANLRRISNNGHTYLHLAVENKKLTSLRELLDHCVPVDSKNSAGLTPIMLSIERDDVETVALLAELGADLRQPYGSGTLLHLAADKKSKNSIRWLAQQGLPVDSKDSAGLTPIMLSVERDDAETVALLADLGANLNQLYGELSLLHYAVVHSSRKSVGTLVQKGLPPDLKADGETPLMLAVERDDTALAAELVKFRADLWQRWRADHINLVHWAAIHNDLAALRWLVDKGLDADSTDDNSLRPLHYAASYGRYEAAVTLVTKLNACLNCRDYNGRTALWWAYQHDHADVMEFLKSNGAIY